MRYLDWRLMQTYRHRKHPFTHEHTHTVITLFTNRDNNYNKEHHQRPSESGTSRIAQSHGHCVDMCLFKRVMWFTVNIESKYESPLWYKHNKSRTIRRWVSHHFDIWETLDQPRFATKSENHWWHTQKKHKAYAPRATTAVIAINFKIQTWFLLLWFLLLLLLL